MPRRSGAAGLAPALRAGLARLAAWLTWQCSPALAVTFGEPIFRLLGRRQARDAAAPQRILVLRLDEIGDVVLSTGFLRELRRSFPNAWITLVVGSPALNLVEHCPDIDETLAFSAGRHGIWRLPFRHWLAISFAVRQLLPRRFDLAICPRWDLDTYHASFVAYFSGAPRRVGYSSLHRGAGAGIMPRLDLLLTDAVRDERPLHEAVRGLNLVRWLGGTVQAEHLELTVAAEDGAFRLDQATDGDGRPAGPWIALVVGAGNAMRTWPVERFATLAEWAIRTQGARVVLIGGPGEEDLGRALTRRVRDRVVDLTGRLTLRQTAVVLSQCQLCIANDTGPMHLAAAAGVPVVEISCHPANGAPMHARDPRRFAPWAVPHLVVRPARARPPCDESCRLLGSPHCILEVPVAAVQQAAAELLELRRAGQLAPSLNRLKLAGEARESIPARASGSSAPGGSAPGVTAATGRRRAE
ncbi:MAG: glycosyltransferase family 9 protein [Chloroflexi bacterium]|nr:glycosyltransferase family 9 protein [Chloroflexota bacterium]